MYTIRCLLVFVIYCPHHRRRLTPLIRNRQRNKKSISPSSCFRPSSWSNVHDVGDDGNKRKSIWFISDARAERSSSPAEKQKKNASVVVAAASQSLSVNIIRQKTATAVTAALYDIYVCSFAYRVINANVCSTYASTLCRLSLVLFSLRRLPYRYRAGASKRD